MDNNTESLLTSLITSSQPSLNSETTIESFVNTKETPNSRKLPSPDSPQDLVATLKQETKQINDQDKTIVEQKDMMQKQASMIVHICKKKW